MELSLDFEQLQLKSEHLHTNSRRTHYHDDGDSSLFISWSDCVTVLYSLDCLSKASLWNPVEPIILPTTNPVVSVLTFDSKVYCIDEIGSVHHLKQVQRYSPDLFDCSPPTQSSQLLLSCNYEWIVLYSQKCPCTILGATSYSDGIALIATLGDWITIQLLQITLNYCNETIISNTCNKKIRPVKQFPFSVTSFISCTWKDWFSGQCARELFGLNVLDSKDVFLLGTKESKVYCMTSDVSCKNSSLFLDCSQQIVHIQFCDFVNESKKLLLVSSSGILTVMNCVENSPLSLIYLAVTKVVTIYIVDCTLILSDGVHLFHIILDEQFSKVVKQVVLPLTGICSLKKFQFNNIIAMTQLNKVYKLSPKYNVITQEELQLKFNENFVLEDIKNLCKSIESLEEQHGKIDIYTDALSIVARKSLIAQCCSFNILIYSDAKAVKLGARQDESIVAVKLSTDCPWLSFPSKIWQLMIRITDSKNMSSTCGLHSFNTDLFDIQHPLVVKHYVSATVIENCSSGLVSCELVCQIKSDLINRCLIIPLNPIKLNALYFVKVEKREKIAVMNPLENRHRYVFKFPEHLTLVECLTILMNKNKHSTSKSLFSSIMDKMTKTLYLNYFEKIVTIVLDDKTTKTVVIECINQDALIAVRNGVLIELSNNLPVIIKNSVLGDVQKQLCSIEELFKKKQHNKDLVKEIISEIQNKISINLPV